MSTPHAMVTNLSGATAIVSVSTSKTASMIQDSVPPGLVEVIQRTQEVMTTADIVGVCSFVVLFLSFVWNVYSTRKKNQIEERNYMLEREKFELMKDQGLT